MSKIKVFKATGKVNRWALALVDEVTGSNKLNSYARKATAFRGAQRIRTGGVKPLVAMNHDGTWAASARLANKTIVPLRSYKRRATAFRGVNRFSKRLENCAVVAG